MDKREVYEHLAKIYLDASNKYKKKKKKPKHLGLYQNFFLVIFLVALGLTLGLPYRLKQKQKTPFLETSLLILDTPSKLNFNFNPAKKETLSINLNGTNLSSFKELGFSVKNTNPKNLVSLRVELTNSFKEKSEVYIKNVSGKWQEFRISLLDFKKITNWSKVQSLCFTLEEWNVSQHKGIVYVDNVRFLK